MAKADLIFINGGVCTRVPDPQHPDTARWPVAEAAAVSDGRIVYVGGNGPALALADERTVLVDLTGQMLLPSFFEAHAHPSFVVAHDFTAWLAADYDVTAYLQTLRTFLDQNPGLDVLRGFGWNNAAFGPEGPHRASLDAVSTSIPIVLHSLDHHALWVNSRALQLAGISAATSAGAGIIKDAAGEPTGTLREDVAMDLVLKSLPDASVYEYKASILNYQTIAQHLGITGVLDAMVPVDSHCSQAYQELAAENQLAMYVRLAWLLEPGKSDEQLAWIRREQERRSRSADPAGLLAARTAKFFIDGVVEGATAYLLAPYDHRPDSRGAPLWSAPALLEAFRHCEALGLQIHAHTIGDAAVRLALDCLSQLEPSDPPGLRRHALTHLQLIHPDDIPRLAGLGIVAIVNPYWAWREKTFADLELRFLGQRADHIYPIRSLFDQSVMVAAASDYPITIDPDPLFALEAAVNRTAPRLVRGDRTAAACSLNRPEAITPAQALDSLTVNAAYTCFLEHETGSIAVGQSADLTVVDTDLLSLPGFETTRAAVCATFFRGRTVYDSGLLRIIPAPAI